MNLSDPVDEAIAAVPDRVALIVGDDRITYARLGDAIARAASSLAAAGVGRGHRVPLVDVTGLLATATVLACARLGAAAAPMSTRLTAPEIEAMARAAGCGLVSVAGAEFAGVVGSASGRAPLDASILEGAATRLDAAPDTDAETAVVLFTSGTTGIPRPVPLTHGILGGRVRAFSPKPEPGIAPPVTLLCVPFHHVAGLVGVLVGLAGGTTTVVQSRFDAGEWLRLVSEHRVQRTFLVPTMINRIIEHPGFARADLGSLQMITYGAAPASEELIARAVEAMPGVAFIQVFGQTETLGAVTALGPDDHRTHPASVGKAMPGVDVRIVDPESGDDVGEGEVGEFWVRAPHTATDGWVRSGDLVRRDADGYLYAMGRLSDVINRAGEKIDPLEVEAVLRSHPAVTDVAVFGAADPDLGEQVAAAIVASAPIDEEDVRAWCRARLADFKVPRRIVVVDELPLTEVGKVSRRALRALLDP